MMNNKVILKVTAFPVVSETFVLNSFVAAIEKGKEVQLITNELRSVENSSQPELIKKYDLLNKTLLFKRPIENKRRKIDFFKVLFNPVQLFYLIKYFLIQNKLSLQYAFHLNFYKNLRKAAVFHIHFLPALTPLLELKKIGYLKSKLVITFHGYDAHHLPEKKVLDEMLSDIEKYVDRVTVNSAYLKEKLVSQGFQSAMIDIVPIAINTNFFKNDKNRDFNAKKIIRLISIGRLIPLKGQRYGIAVIKMLIDAGYKVRYTIVGEGASYESLKRLVQECHLEEFVTFKGEQTQIEIKQLLSIHDIFLMTSTEDDKGVREAFGVVSLEAQSMGLPVIGFESGGFPDTLIDQETGFIVKDRDVVAMYHKIILLINDLNLLESMSHNAIKHAVGKFDLSNSDNQYIKYYNV